MIYLGVAIVIAIIAALILLLSLRLLIGNWIIAWLRGSAGLILAACTVLLGLIAWDLHSYQQISDSQPIATLTINKVDDKQFTLNLIDQTGNEQHYQLSGDLWQLDARLLVWVDMLARLGIKPGYRLDHLSGRYLELADEQKLPHAAVQLNAEQPLFDTWSWLRSVNRYFSVIEAIDSSTSYLPMVDGALYSVSVVRSGIVAQPLNERAKLAAEQWQ